MAYLSKYVSSFNNVKLFLFSYVSEKKTWNMLTSYLRIFTYDGKDSVLVHFLVL